MRLLADENFPKPCVDMLRSVGNDVLWARSHFPGGKDADLLDLAEADSRILITLDKDFWQLAVQRRVPLVNSGVVLLRAHPATVKNLELLIHALMRAQTSWVGHISIIAADGIQMLASRTR